MIVRLEVTQVGGKHAYPMDTNLFKNPPHYSDDFDFCVVEVPDSTPIGPGITQLQRVPDKQYFYNVQTAKERAKDMLEAEYQNRLSQGTIGGMLLDKILPNIVKADMVIAAGAANFAVVYKGETQLLNATKLTLIKTYWYDCSQTAKQHFQNINRLTTKVEIRDYVQNDMVNTLWPDPAL